MYSVGLFSSYRASVPVISVGNITAGGTGKTPVVDALVKYCISQGRKVAIVSRGYKGNVQQDSCRVTESHPPDVVGDEPYLLAKRNPTALVYVSPKRRHGVMAAEADGANCMLLDDGFQHLAVQRDLDIVLLDERNPFGNGTVIPAGYLREPRSAMRRADFVVQTHSDFADLTLASGVGVVKCIHCFADYLVDRQGNQISWDVLQGKRCLAFAGIAHPEDFFGQLRSAGCVLHETLPLEDHLNYTPGVLEQINRASQDVDFLLTTEKDFVKLHGTEFSKPCLAIPLQLDFDNFASLTQALDKVLGGCNE